MRRLNKHESQYAPVMTQNWNMLGVIWISIKAGSIPSHAISPIRDR